MARAVCAQARNEPGRNGAQSAAITVIPASCCRAPTMGGLRLFGPNGRRGVGVRHESMVRTQRSGEGASMIGRDGRGGRHDARQPGLRGLGGAPAMRSGVWARVMGGCGPRQWFHTSGAKIPRGSRRPDVENQRRHARAVLASDAGRRIPASIAVNRDVSSTATTKYYRRHAPCSSAGPRRLE
jgi:hypothetical protein